MSNKNNETRPTAHLLYPNLSNISEQKNWKL